MDNDDLKWGFCNLQSRRLAVQDEGLASSRIKATSLSRQLMIVAARFSPLICLWVIAAILVPDTAAAATQSPKMPVTPKWGRFEQAFTSSITYTNPLQEVTLKVQFTSPLGEIFQVYGFWDGGRTWRVRFSPDQPGHWTFYTTCSDSGNTGLNGQHGQFLCTSTIGQSPLRQHGRVRVAMDRHHLEYADGTPFFWLADNVKKGALVADQKSWGTYAVIRSSQNFTVAQWGVATGGDLEHESALTGFPECIGINPDFFKRLDAKLDILSAAGILSAISPLSEITPPPQAVALPDDQAVLLTRYIVARWGGEPVAWLVEIGGDNKQIDRWKKIGAEVFSTPNHAPVLVYSQLAEGLQPFAEQPWVDMLGLQMPSALSANAQTLVRVSETHPIIVFTPHENAIENKTKTRITAEGVRRSAYCGLLMAPPAGVSYASLQVANWDTTVDSKATDAFGAGLPIWHKALFMPGAKQLSQMANLMNSIAFWRLSGEPGTVTAQPIDASSTPVACAAASSNKDLSLIYLAEARMLELPLDAMPHSPTVSWFNPRQGGNNPAVAVVVQGKCQFPTPDPHDWVLVLKAGK